MLCVTIEYIQDVELCIIVITLLSTYKARVCVRRIQIFCTDTKNRNEVMVRRDTLFSKMLARIGPTPSAVTLVLNLKHKIPVLHPETFQGYLGTWVN